MTKNEISRFCGQLKMLLSSGVPLLEALYIIQHIARRNEYADVIKKVSEGEKLSAALQPYFPPLVISYIGSGEKTGNLEEALDYLHKYYESRAAAEERMKSALIYPAFVMVLCVLSFLIMMIFVLPGFKSLFSDFAVELPLLTRIIIGGGELLSRFFWIFCVLVVLGSLYLRRYRRTESGAIQIDTYAMKIKLVCHGQIIQSFRTLGVLLQGGVPVATALEAAVSSIHNRCFKSMMLSIKKEMENGGKLSEALTRFFVFPAEAIQMVRVGENTGNLDQMLLGVADFYEKETEVLIKRFAAMLEPVLTLLVGLVVGVIALAVFLPMVNMISGLQ